MLVTWKKSLAALAATLAIGLPIALTLAAAPSPDRRETPIEPEGVYGDSQPVLFAVEAPAGDPRVHETTLHMPAIVTLMTHVEIKLLFYQSDHSEPHPVQGRIELAGTACRFETPPNSYVDDSRPLSFVRAGDCAAAGAPTGDLHLTMTMGGPGALRIYTRRLAEADRTSGAIYATAPGAPAADHALVVMGWFVDDLASTGLRRVNLLAYVWTTDLDAWPVWTALGGVLVVLWLGIMCLPFAPLSEFATRGAFVTRAAIGTGVLALALASLYGLLIPPFQAADESHHFVSFAAVAGRPELINAARVWGTTGHQTRIMGRPFERFRPRDVRQPLPVLEGVPGGFEVHTTEGRSSLTTRMWQLMGAVLPEGPVNHVFLAGRIWNSLLFATAATFAAMLLAAYAPARYPQLLIFPVLFVPSLPFFGMLFGESAVVVVTSIVFTAAAALVVLGADRFPALGLLLGLLFSAFFVAARNSLPMLPMVLTIVMLRILGAVGANRSPRETKQFWIGFAIGASVYPLLLTDLNRQWLLDVLARVVGRVPGAPAILSQTMQPWFPALASLAGFAVETYLRRPLGKLWARSRPAIAAAAAVVPLMLIALIVLSFAGSLWFDYPVVESIQGSGRASLSGYFTQVAGTAATIFRWTRPSLLLSGSFWVGFGWLDTMPGPNFIAILLTLTGLALSGLLWHVARRRDARLFVAMAMVAAGLVVTLIGYTFVSYGTLTNLHGRYLLGWYLTFVTMCWLWPAIAGTRTESPRDARVVVLLAMAGGLHAYAAHFILLRYF